MPRKPLTPMERPTLRAAEIGLVFNPPRLPHVSAGFAGEAAPPVWIRPERTLKFFLHTGHSSKRSCYQHTKYSSVRTIIAYGIQSDGDYPH